ncbi:DUF4226 domain-containing protein (plasmid) [Mycobacterium avium subsp. hominissuis]|uniref:DUF4226 domain-containing protein n=3 Tax=Mycobacterium avium TaxID=1764 RepID=UPI0010712D85|nr:DUF4226 domain-containing protein [Mycobacterium avium]QLK92857.1 DUF4226 domain-containing protein [Mycobacterium avium subsp. hominissuis]QWY63676.1 DUF4226 domain-containing protein [Mycobacterium avium subsp. hominissuis]QWY65070.1 DUF4226 domain-containing protein [Mycobacterium avium subsp. hominissuis]
MPNDLQLKRGFGRAMGLFDVLDDLFDDLSGIFGGDDDDGPPEQSVLPGAWPSGAAPWGPAPAPPGGPSGLQEGAGQAGTTYQQASAAVDQTDEKLSDLLKQIFATNDQNRARISGIIASIETARTALTSNPQTAGDPQAMALFNQFLDGQLAQIQQVLDSSKVDSKKQAELLAALGDEYRGTGGADPKKKGKDDGTGDGGSSGDGDGGGSAAGGGDAGDGDGTGAGATTTGGGAGGGLTDPLAGLGGAGMGDPLSALGPAMAGLGSLPGSLGGAAGSFPMDALGALGPLASGLAGQGAGDGFKDGDTHDHGKSDDFQDGSHGKDDSDGGKNGDGTSGKDDTGDKSDKNGQTQPAGTTQQPQPNTQPASPAAVPVSAGGDPSKVVQMPDGSPVTATTAQHAAAVRAVLNGSTVSDAWKQDHVDLPPPGTPVTAPADPSHLVPGQIAQFKSRDPVMYMGNGKIWLDGQLQPQSALPTGDFLGWVDPPQLAGTTPAPTAPGAAAPAGQPGITNTSGS